KRVTEQRLTGPHEADAHIVAAVIRAAVVATGRAQALRAAAPTAAAEHAVRASSRAGRIDARVYPSCTHPRRFRAYRTDPGRWPLLTHAVNKSVGHFEE